MALPKPNCSFVIPSIHDDLELNCRIYYPRRTEQNAELFGGTFAIFAHPYAPLGGSYDDPVVGIAGGVLLRYGCVLVTFNFRGASGSAGRTSWSGKAELADYVSVYGFVLCYIDAVFREVSGPVSDDDTNSVTGPPILILGGYSYGSMIAAHLPSLETVTGILKEPKPDSAESEIRLRANDLAKDMKAYFAMHPAAGGSHALPNSPSQMGGYGSDAASRRIHRESSRRSIDGERVRKSVDRVRRKLSRDTSGRIQSVSSDNTVESKPPATRSSPVMPRLAYVLVSPLLSTVAGFTTVFSKLKFTPKGGGGGIVPTEEFHELVSHPCCCLYGTEDIFTSERKLRRWTEELVGKAGPKFVVVTAQTGHFWREADGPLRIRQGLADWLRALLPTLEESHPQNIGKTAS
ncbi:Alpha/Beta hydrolase protein [Exophiala viscosa]|uniref:Alpha/Beta hydrolase protein n=1 Tax=Exophiala viscosa TaxID=2486360 RepID=A0AAN6DZ04_9EURO|nr:Alpha/Beta hydrolase protein [Exophiala viscosa]